jgi:DNA repair protein RadC
LLRMEEISLGSVNESIAHPRCIPSAVISSAYAVIVVHNHPFRRPLPQPVRSQPNETFG